MGARSEGPAYRAGGIVGQCIGQQDLGIASRVGEGADSLAEGLPALRWART